MGSLSNPNVTHTMTTKLQPVDITRFRKIGHDIAQYHEPYGKHSKLFQYCNRAIRRGYSKFVLVCVEDTSGTVAFDVHSEEAESALDIRQIRSWFYGRHGYWRRLLPKRVKVVPVKVSLNSDRTMAISNSSVDLDCGCRSIR